MSLLRSELKTCNVIPLGAAPGQRWRGVSRAVNEKWTGTHAQNLMEVEATWVSCNH